MKFIFSILLFLTLLSCSPVKRFNRLIERHPELITSDTVTLVDTFRVVVPEVKVDTTTFSADAYGYVSIIPTAGNGGTAYITQGTNAPRNGGNLAIRVNAAVQGGNFSIETNGSEKFRILPGGNVGIGTTSPGALLQIGNTSSANELLRLGLSYTSDRSARGAVAWRDSVDITGRIYTEYDGTMVSLVFGSLYNSGYNSNNLMIIRGNGNVGIGTITPGYKLEVVGTGKFTGAVTIGNSSGTPSTENTLNIYPSPAGGTGEGGQILLAAAGGSYTKAAMLDTW